ncbi:MAG: RadC family protein [Nanoarchaeota archaeon]
MAHLRIHDLPTDSKPRERLIRLGAAALSDAELLALVLRTGNADENAVRLAERILSDLPLARFGQTVRQFSRFSGVGEAKACALMAVGELIRRRNREAACGQKREHKIIQRPDQVYALVEQRLEGVDQEHFLALYLDTRKQLLSVSTLFVGTLDAIVVHPRDIFRKALQERAASVVIVHNHPSGDPDPSDEDIAFTRQVQKAGKMMGISLVDHVIIGDGRYFSFVDEGLL